MNEEEITKLSKKAQSYISKLQRELADSNSHNAILMAIMNDSAPESNTRIDFSLRDGEGFNLPEFSRVVFTLGDSSYRNEVIVSVKGEELEVYSRGVGLIYHAQASNVLRLKIRDFHKI